MPLTDPREKEAMAALVQKTLPDQGTEGGWKSLQRVHADRNGG